MGLADLGLYGLVSSVVIVGPIVASMGLMGLLARELVTRTLQNLAQIVGTIPGVVGVRSARSRRTSSGHLFAEVTILVDGATSVSASEASAFGMVPKPEVCISSADRMPPIQAPVLMPTASSSRVQAKVVKSSSACSDVISGVKTRSGT